MRSDDMKRRNKLIALPLIVTATFASVGAKTSAQTLMRIDPDAMAALDKMAAYLGTLDAFQVKAEITTEVVLVDGQKVQIGSAADMVAVRPNRLRVSLASDLEERLLLYD
jgi:hypothetical protein